MSKLQTSLISLFLLSLPVLSWAGLKEDLINRSVNYNHLSNHYRSLLEAINTNNHTAFCTLTSEAYPMLVNILEEDNLLIKSLRREIQDHFHEYAVHIETNMYSPLFAHNSYSGRCKTTDSTELSTLFQSISYNLMNVSFLKQNHELWMEAYVGE